MGSESGSEEETDGAGGERLEGSRTRGALGSLAEGAGDGAREPEREPGRELDLAGGPGRGPAGQMWPPWSSPLAFTVIGFPQPGQSRLGLDLELESWRSSDMV